MSAKSAEKFKSIVTQTKAESEMLEDQELLAMWEMLQQMLLEICQKMKCFMKS